MALYCTALHTPGGQDSLTPVPYCSLWQTDRKTLKHSVLIYTQWGQWKLCLGPLRVKTGC